MAELFEQVTTYARLNPGVVVCACITVLLIGVTQFVLKPNGSTSSKQTGTSSGGMGISGGILTPEYIPFPLIDKREISHNTKIFRFALPSATSCLGLPLGQHISLRANIDQSEVRRPYTPISSISTKGYFELLIKVYPSPHGLMSRHLDSLIVGRDSIDVRGPLGKFSYGAANTFRTINMVCGGTGITPMWQVIIALLEEDRSENTRMNLVFANVNEEDILLRDELDELHSNHGSRFNVYYVVNNKPNDAWTGGVGFVTTDILREQFSGPGDGVKVLMCGPPPMNKAMKGVLSGLGYSDRQIFKF